MKKNQLQKWIVGLMIFCGVVMLFGGIYGWPVVPGDFARLEVFHYIAKVRGWIIGIGAFLIASAGCLWLRRR